MSAVQRSKQQVKLFVCCPAVLFTYPDSGERLPSDTVELCRSADAILFGSVGGPVAEQNEPKWKDAEKNAILGLRKTFGLAVNIRPAKVWPFLSDLSPLKHEIIEKGVREHPELSSLRIRMPEEAQQRRYDTPCFTNPISCSS